MLREYPIMLPGGSTSYEIGVGSNMRMAAEDVLRRWECPAGRYVVFGIYPKSQRVARFIAVFDGDSITSHTPWR